MFLSINIPRCWVLLLATISLLLSTGHGYKILLSAMPGKSHIYAVCAIAKQLASQGHQVHFLIGESVDVPLDPNTSNVTIERYGNPEFMTIDYDRITSKMTEEVLGMNGGISEVQSLLDQFFHDDSRQLLMNSEHLFEKFEQMKFDLAVVDSIFMMTYQYLVPHRLGIPWVTVSVLLNPWEMQAPMLPSFFPSKLSPFSDDMTFIERLKNVLFTLVPYFLIAKDPPADIMQKYRQFGYFKNTNELVAKSSLFITTCDPVMDYGMPITSNTIRAGGLTVHPASGRPLPGDIEAFMAAPNDGIIIMTFGTLAKHIPLHMAVKFVEAFRRLDRYRIIWRVANNDNITMPDNVMVLPWLPQNDLLADKRVKLFITHCGNNGQYEALYHAVPMIGFPIFVDQDYNAKRIQSKGFGIAMNIHDFTSDELLKNVHTILKDSSYKARITKASQIYRSAKESPVERVVYWLEHVIRFGADHLQSSGRNLNLLQYLMVDIAAFILMILILLIVVIKFLFKLAKNRIGNVYQFFNKQLHAKKVA